MTPQERELVADLFDRLAKLENAPRDPDAERVIADGQRQAPHAVYALVQTTLVQDEALKRANARIQDLQAQLGGGDEPQRQGGFLDTMRDALLGPREQRGGSVPTVRPQQSTGGSSVWGNQQAQPPGYPQAAPYPQQAGYPQAGYPQPGFGGGGSFLGTAASAAAGVIGGSLLLDGIRSMMGHHGGGFGAYDSRASGDMPWGGGGGELAREAGLNDIGRSNDSGGQDRAGLFDTAADDSGDNDADYGNDSDFDSGGDVGGDGGSDYA